MLSICIQRAVAQAPVPKAQPEMLKGTITRCSAATDGLLIAGSAVQWQEQGPSQEGAPALPDQLQSQSASPLHPTGVQSSLPSAIARMADAPNPFQALVTAEQPSAAKPMFAGLNAIVNPFQSPSSSPPRPQSHTATAGLGASAPASDAPNSSVADPLVNADTSRVAPITLFQQALASASLAVAGGASASASHVQNPVAAIPAPALHGAGSCTGAPVSPNQHGSASAATGSSIPGSSTPACIPAATPVISTVALPVVGRHNAAAPTSMAAAAHSKSSMSVSMAPAAHLTAQESSRTSDSAQAEVATASAASALPSLASAAVPSAAAANLQRVFFPAAPLGLQGLNPSGASAPLAPSAPLAAVLPMTSVTASVPATAANLPTTTITATVPAANLPPSSRAAAGTAAANLAPASTAAVVPAASANSPPASAAAAGPATKPPPASAAAAGPATNLPASLTAAVVPAAPASLLLHSTAAAVPAAAAGSRPASKRKWDVMAQPPPDGATATSAAAAAAASHAVASGIAAGGLPPPPGSLLPAGSTIKSSHGSLVTGTQPPASSTIQLPTPGPPPDGLAAVDVSHFGSLAAAPLPASQVASAAEAAQAAAGKALAGKDLAAKLAADFAQQHKSKQLAVTTAAGSNGQQAAPVDVSIAIKAAAAAAAEKVLQERAVRAKAAAEKHIHEQALKAIHSVQSSGDVHAARMEALRLRNAARHGSPQAPTDQVATTAVVPEPQLTAHVSPQHPARSQHPEALSDDSRSKKKRGRDEDHAAFVEHGMETVLPGPPPDPVADLSRRRRESADSPASAGSRDSLRRQGKGYASDSRQVWQKPSSTADRFTACMFGRRSFWEQGRPKLIMLCA